MNKKILTFVYGGREFLLLRNNSKDPSHGGDYWFTVTGSVEDNETHEQAVIREVLEETGLVVKETMRLNCGSIYNWQNQDHEEKNFIAFVEQNKIKLNEEYVDFEWLKLSEFIDRLNWGLDKEELRNVLQKAIKRELFFKKEKIKDFRLKAT